MACLSGIQFSGGSIVLFADNLLLHSVDTCTENFVFKMTLMSYVTGYPITSWQ
jgi:hypothetical protein